jgi:hypothetical protein
MRDDDGSRRSNCPRRGLGALVDRGIEFHAARRRRTSSHRRGETAGSRADAVVFADADETPASDEQRSPAGARSAPVPLLHP